MARASKPKKHTGRPSKKKGPSIPGLTGQVGPPGGLGVPPGGVAQVVQKLPGAQLIPGLAPPRTPLEGQVLKLAGATTSTTGTETRSQRRKKGTKKTPEEIAKLKANANEARKTPEGIAATKNARTKRKDKTRNARAAREEKAKLRNAAIANEHLRLAAQASNTTPTPGTVGAQKLTLPPTQAVAGILHDQRLMSPDGQTALRRTHSEAAANIQHQKTKAENITKINNAISKLNNFTKRPQQDIASITAALTAALKSMPARQLNSANSSQKDKIIAEMQAELGQLKQQGQQEQQQPRQRQQQGQRQGQQQGQQQYQQQQGQPQKPPDYSGFLGRLRSIRDIFSRSQYSSNVNKAKRKAIQQEQTNIKTQKKANRQNQLSQIVEHLRERQGQGQGQEVPLKPEGEVAPAEKISTVIPALAPAPEEKLPTVTPAPTPAPAPAVAPAVAVKPFIEPRIGSIFNGGSRKKQLFKKKPCQKEGFKKFNKQTKKTINYK